MRIFSRKKDLKVEVTFVPAADAQERSEKLRALLIKGAIRAVQNQKKKI